MAHVKWHPCSDVCACTYCARDRKRRAALLTYTVTNTTTGATRLVRATDRYDALAEAEADGFGTDLTLAAVRA
jgi:hypothetical protein